MTAYEMLALVCALLLSVCVTFYTSNASDHVYGIVGCVANCALWMATLSSAFFAVVINTCETDEQVSLLVNLYGRNLMRVPMMLFVWGCTMLFLEFILFFKLNVDAGFSCSMCLGSCLIVAPLFFHSMHKMGWSATVVHEQARAEQRLAQPPTTEDLHATLGLYIETKGTNPLAWDCDDFLHYLKKPHVKVTSP